MQKFFTNIDSIESFSLALDYHQDTLHCAHCSKNDQFVSHGFVYKQRSIARKEKVGKRIFCSNRYGRSGCGRTFQLYVASEIPTLRYGAAQLFLFITALLANLTVTEAYLKATLQLDTRNAWRWLNKLMGRLSNYRSVLTIPKSLSKSSGFKTRRFQILLPTLAQLFAKYPHYPCAHYQLTSQTVFI